MARKYEAFPGMEDILPGEVEKWQWLEEKARIFLESRGFHEIRTPLLEPTELFTRSIGDASDIVHKEMYTFEDRGGRSMTLRPEMTASVARSVMEHGLLKTSKSLRLYYMGPMFRSERPQAGRKRQFHQIGVEIVNESGPRSDFEAVSLLCHLLRYAGLEKFSLRLNDLGKSAHRSKVRQALEKYFSGQKEKLCKDCLWRLEKNVLRIFDCKVEACQPVIQKAPWEEISPLGEDFKELTEQLGAHQIPFEIKRRLVRGLDYYSGAVFEAAAEGLGAQDAVAGGGRYDELYAGLGGASTPCTGFSIGMERLLTSLEKTGASLAGKIRQRKVYLAPLEASCQILKSCADQAVLLRERGIRVETTPEEVSLSKHLKRANQAGLRYIVMLGPDEIKKGKWTVKDLDGKKQSEIAMDRLAAYLEEILPL